MHPVKQLELKLNNCACGDILRRKKVETLAVLSARMVFVMVRDSQK